MEANTVVAIMSSSVTRASTYFPCTDGLLPWHKTSDCQCGAIVEATEADMMCRVVVQVPTCRSTVVHGLPAIVNLN
jgi:hypothetical protein